MSGRPTRTRRPWDGRAAGDCTARARGQESEKHEDPFRAREQGRVPDGRRNRARDTASDITLGNLNNKVTLKKLHRTEDTGRKFTHGFGFLFPLKDIRL